jgi:hypothetical protein
MRPVAVETKRKRIRETDNPELHELQKQQPPQHQLNQLLSTNVQQAPMTVMSMPHAPTWQMVTHALATAASREMVLAVLMSMSAQMAAITVMPMHSAKTLLVHFSASATQATLETGSLAVISMNVLVATHAQITPLVQIALVIFHAPVILDTKEMAWSEVKEANVKISTSAKESTTVTKMHLAKILTVVTYALATLDMKEAVLLAAKSTSVSLVPTSVTQTQHASPPLADSNVARSDQEHDHTFANVMTVMKAMATNAQR